MKNGERVIVVTGFAVLVFAWLGFLLHVAPRFAGSGLGIGFGITGALLMLLPLAYVVGKRIPGLKSVLTRFVSLQTWLSIHIYAGLLGSLFAIVHTGHKYVSPLGAALTASMLLVVVSGIVLRYLTPFVNLDLKDKLLLLQTGRGDLDNAWGRREKAQRQARRSAIDTSLTSTMASLGLSSHFADPPGEVVVLAEGVADLEYSIRTDELLRRCFSWGLKIHIIVSIAFYSLLTAHIASGIYFGLRWYRE